MKSKETSESKEDTERPTTKTSVASHASDSIESYDSDEQEQIMRTRIEKMEVNLLRTSISKLSAGVKD